MSTLKPLAISVRFTSNRVDMQAFMAGLGCVSWVNKNQIHAKLYCFVSKELTQLIKRPTITPAPLCFRAWLFISAFSDARQIFQSYSLVCTLGVLDQAIADSMVYLCLESALTPTQPLQKLPTSTPTTSCAFGRFLLQRSSHARIFIPNLSYFSSTELLSRER